MKLIKHIQASVLGVLICLGGGIPQSTAQLIPVNDNTAPPYVGVFGGPLSESPGLNWDDNFGSWLNRSGVWAEGFNGSSGPNAFSWTSGVEGNSSYYQAGKRWVEAHPGSVYVLSVPMLPGVNGIPSSGHTLAKGANGDYDAHFVTLAQKLVTYGPPSSSIVIRLGWEFNGTWYPWCIKNGTAGRNPADFANYFKRIVTVMKGVSGCENLRFCWNGANVWTSYNVSEAYPCDRDVNGNITNNSYVDYVGVDQYDVSFHYSDYTGPLPYPTSVTNAAWNDHQLDTDKNWKSSLSVWKAVAESPNYGQGKPLSIPEWGLSTNANGGKDNPEFIRHMFEFIHDPANNVAWHVYFDTLADGSEHRIHTLPWGTLANPVASAKFKQLFGLPLPDANDIGSTGVAGSADGITVSGAGAGYVNTSSDSFFFSSGASSSDDMLIAKFISMSASASAQTGLMIRQNTNANAIYAALILNDGKCFFQTRASTGAPAVPYGMALTQAAPTEENPVWLKIVRKGNLITGYLSTDSVNWKYVGGQSVAVGSSAKIGIAVSSGNTSTLNVTGLDKGTDKLENADFYRGLEENVHHGIIVDDADSTTGAIVKTGSWTADSTAVGYYGGGYQKSPSSGTASVKFTPSIPSAGLYSVYVRWPQDVAFSYDTPLSIVSTEGTVNMTANQSVGRNMWHYAGTYDFAEGTAGSVTIGRSSTYGVSVADAVMFVPAPQHLIVDNTQAELGGTWGLSTGATGQYHGINYLKDSGANKGNLSARFRPTIPKTGTYQVYAAWSNAVGVTYATNVPYTVTHAGGTTNLSMNQAVNGGGWNLVGTYTFTAGTSGNVLVSNTGTANGAQVIVDAMKFVFVPPAEVIVDNQQADLTEGTGTWTVSTAAEGQFHGEDYLHDSNTGKGTKKARFTPDLPAAGVYEVYAKWNVKAGTSYSNSVSYAVNHSGGTDNPIINQQVNGALWNLIGTYSFPAGSAPGTGSVLITNTGSGNVIVDAIKWVKVDGPVVSIIDNPGFEDDASGAQTITGWDETGSNPDASFTSSSVTPHGGAAYLGHWKSTSYNVFTSQTRSGLTNGSYTLTAWVQRSGSQTTAQMEASGFGGSTMTAAIPVSSSWTQVTISGINVTNGTCTFGFRSVSPGNSSMRVDDAEFTKN